MNLNQTYLDICTSFQCEPKYPDDVKMILEELSKSGKILPNDLLKSTNRKSLEKV